MTSNPRRRGRGRPKGARGRKTIARLTAMEKYGKTKLPTWLAVLSVLQKQMLGKNSENAARLYEQIEDALQPQAPAEPALYVLAPELLGRSDWEARAAALKSPATAIPQSVVQPRRKGTTSP